MNDFLDLHDQKETRCKHCGKKIPTGRAGRREYCSNRCRQAAYRQRLKQLELTEQIETN